MHDTVDAQFAWRLPVGFDAEAFMKELEEQANRPAASRPIRPTGQQASQDHLRSEVSRATRKRGAAIATTRWCRSFLAGLRTVEASEKLGFVLKTGTSDMNVVGPVWQCPIVAYGPGDSSLDHTPNEHLPLDEYWKAVNVIEQTLRAFSGCNDAAL